MGGFVCPRCRMAFSSQPLLRAHEEKLCLGMPAATSSRLPGGDLLPAEGAPGMLGRPQDTVVWRWVWGRACGDGTGSGDGDRDVLWVGVSQPRDHAEPGHLLLLPGPPLAMQGSRRARGAPLGDVLTPRERALLRAAEPASRSMTVEQAVPARRPAPPQGHQQQPQELVEAHERHVAEIRARTQQLEQQREGLCQRLVALGDQAAVDPHPKQGDVELIQAPGTLRDPVGHMDAAHRQATLHLATLLPATGPLAAEARALRLSYLRAGGHDPHILDQLLHLQVEATVLEKGPTGQRRSRRMAEPPPAVPAEPPSAGARGLDAALLAVELENRRLEDELLALKVRREKRADAGSQAAQRQAEELAQLQAEVGMLRCHTERMGPRLPPAIFPPPVAPPLPPAPAAPELLADFPRPVLGTGSPTAPGHPHVPPGLPLTSFVALEDPPPAQELPAQHQPPHPQR
ncbi:coiled-coil domain-containing protein 17 [Strigops habroptila]|uniref:coiled-coil domain-containing protein 17 n=1 Tax=Strigops habroptila TaxID=2489341 RepID=UPI0011CF8A70|nr:coiled-coil domain-containing protein 17 [Strigops habroptila]